MYCPSCSAKNPDQARFCRSCGSKLVIAPGKESKTTKSGGNKTAKFIGSAVLSFLGVIFLLAGLIEGQFFAMLLGGGFLWGAYSMRS